MKKVIFLLLIVFTCSTYSFAEEFPEIKGWSAKDDVITYRSGNLWEYINGAADQFLSYDFRVLKLREFVKEGTHISVEIYDMGSQINAFGIYTTERPSDAQLLKIGTEAVVIPPYHGLMFKNQYYVKIMIQEGELDQQTGEQILKDVDKYIPGSSDFPDELNSLSKKNQMPGSIKYVTRGYMGLSEINNLLFADYKNNNGKEYRAFVLLLPDKSQVDETLKRLSGKWGSETHEGLTILFRKVPYEGLIGVVMKNSIITGVSGVEDKNTLFGLLHID